MRTSSETGPILSIAIPTLNRPRQLRSLLQSIVCQDTEGAEVIIRDDSESDDTETIVMEFIKKKVLPIHYIRGTREGIDPATLTVVERAHGEYVWTFGDDDFFIPGSISRVVQTLQMNPDITFAWANYRSDNAAQPVLNFGTDRFFYDRNEVITKVSNLLSLMSAMIFKRSVVMEAKKLVEREFGSWWSMLIYSLEAITHGRSYYFQGPLFVNYPLSGEEFRAVGFHDNGFVVFGVNFKRIYGYYSHFFSRSAIRKVIGDNFRNMWRGVFVGWMNHQETPRGKVIQMLRLYWMYPECWFATLLFLMPFRIASQFYGQYRLLKQRRCK